MFIQYNKQTKWNRITTTERVWSEPTLFRRLLFSLLLQWSLLSCLVASKWFLCPLYPWGGCECEPHLPFKNCPKALYLEGLMFAYLTRPQQHQENTPQQTFELRNKAHFEWSRSSSCIKVPVQREKIWWYRINIYLSIYKNKIAKAFQTQDLLALLAAPDARYRFPSFRWWSHQRFVFNTLSFLLQPRWNDRMKEIKVRLIDCAKDPMIVYNWPLLSSLFLFR